MLSTVFSAGLEGIDGFLVTVECNVADRIYRFEIVGLPDMAVKEAKERIKNACNNSGYLFYDGEITVNLAPAGKKKEGSSYDLAILIGILCSMGVIKREVSVGDMCFIGELSLSGAIRPVRGVLPMCLAARDAGMKSVFVPAENAAEASAVKDIDIYGVPDVKSLVAHLNKVALLEKTAFDDGVFLQLRDMGGEDFSEVKGQSTAKRALEIAAAGGHNVLLIGPPGTGKSMLAKRLPSILPEMSFDEAVETTKIHSVSGNLSPNGSLVAKRPFRSPHHNLSAAALVGGGIIPRPGEISLAHNGVLFLDELPEFNRSAAEALRQPLEDGKITVSRANARSTFPASFILVCAMNPCPCGFYGSTVRECTCRQTEIKKYMSKISGPLLDRIDIQIEMPALTYGELTDDTPAQNSASIRARVNAARDIARKRFSGGTRRINCNAEMNSKAIREHCRLEPDADALLKSAFLSMNMSARGYDRVLRVARTIADLAGEEKITAGHIAEAVQLRSLDRKYLN